MRPAPTSTLCAATLGLVLALANAGPVAAQGVKRPASAATAEPASMRLPATVVPQAVRVHLDVDPDQPRHRGEVEIDLLLKAALPAPGAIQLHARELQLGEVWLDVGSKRWRGRARQVDAERVELRFDRALPAGPAQLHISFAGQMAEQDVYGLFRQQETGPGGPQWGAYTQFQAIGARRAFPLFDEPGWKLPWTLSLTVPQRLSAVSNMPVAAERAARPGFKRVDFQPTPPLPSYLLAFGVARLAVVDAGTAGRQAVPVRFIVPEGRQADASFAASVTGRIVGALEDWFDMPYPYAKLDSLALPLTSVFEAMEHPGLVTYGAAVLLANPAERTPRFERDHVSIAAHELAHQWFGNLVTPAWWDDLWLNESFASWLGDKISNTVQPDWPWQANVQAARAGAMRADRLATARSIEQPVLRDEDMGNLWDAITYEKGQVVLAMFEAWAGPDAFRDGVRRFLRRHAWGSATSDDFFQALAATDPALPTAVRSFTRQGGTPRLQVRLLCDDGPPRLALAQSRLLPIATQTGAPAGPAQTWQLPLRVRTPAGESRLLMTTPEASLPLPDATCPAWVQANADGSGYWRTVYEGDGLLRLAAAPGQSTGEWLALLDDGVGLHGAQHIDNRQAVALVRAGAAQPSGEVQAAAAALLLHLQRLVDGAGSAAQTAQASRWQAAFGTRARRLGWLPQPGDSADDRLLRPLLVPLVARLGDDGPLRDQALQLARAWLVDRASLPAELRLPVLAAAALADGAGGGAALFDALLTATRASTVRTERGDLMAVLGHFRQPALAARARALLLEPQVDLRDSLWPLLRAQAEHGPTRNDALDFVLRQWPLIGPRLGEEDQQKLVREFRGGCSDDEARRLEAGFHGSMGRVTGGRLALARSVEAVRLCSAWRTRQGSQLD